MLDLERHVESMRGPLTGLIAAWGAPWPDAEELAQDALAEAFVQRERFRGDPGDLGALGAWVRGIALNLVRNWKRARGRRRTEELADDHPARSGGERGDDELLRAIARLDVRHREVLWMHYLEETGVPELAAWLGATPKAVEIRLYKARKALRAQLERARAAAGSTPAAAGSKGKLR